MTANSRRDRLSDAVSGHFDDLDTVLEFDALDDFRQLFFALQASPCFRGGVDEFKHHQLGGLRRQGPLRPHGSMTHRREHALDRVWRAQMVPVRATLFSTLAVL